MRSFPIGLIKRLIRASGLLGLKPHSRFRPKRKD
jgi:hypothetical protein